MTIQVLMDDYCPKGGLRGEHGLAYLIKDARSKTLFDTGQTEAFLHNAAAAKAALFGIDAVVLNHGHYDHCGGLAALYSSISPAMPTLYAGIGFSRRRYARSDAGLSYIGVPTASLAALAGGFYLSEAMNEALEKVAEGIAASAPGRVLCGH